MLYFSRSKIILILIVIFLGILFSLPNFLHPRAHQYWPSWLPGHQITLETSAQSDTELVLRINRPAMMKEYLRTKREEIRVLFGDAKLAHTGILLRNDHLHAKFRNSADRENAVALLDSEYNSWLQKPISLKRSGPKAIDISVSEKRFNELVDRSLQSLVDNGPKIRR